MIILNRNVTTVKGDMLAGQDVDGVLPKDVCDDLLKRGYAHRPGKGGAKAEADAQEAQQKATETVEAKVTEEAPAETEQNVSGGEAEAEEAEAEEPAAQEKAKPAAKSSTKKSSKKRGGKK